MSVKPAAGALWSPSTLLPFLYNTPTILRAAPRPTNYLSRCTFSSSPSCYAVNQNNPSKYRAPRSEVPFEASSNGSDPQEQPKARSKTLTDEEKKAFQRLFATVGKSKKGIRDGEQDQELKDPSSKTKDALRVAAERIFSGKNAHPLKAIDNSTSELDALLGEVSDKQPSAEEADALLSEEKVSHFPEPLRGMALQAELSRQQSQGRRVRATSPAQDGGSNIDTQTPTNEAVLREEQLFAKLKSEIEEAGTDIEVWKVMERIWANMKAVQDRDSEGGERADQRVKEKSQELAILEKSLARSRRKAANQLRNEEMKTAEKAIDVAEARRLAEEGQREPMFMHLLNAYSALTLAAIRSLTRRTVYTPLTLQLIPRMKSYGLGVYALGLSTALFNEQLAYQFRMLHDYPGMLVSLEEMSNSGVEADDQTLEILSEVSRYRFEAQSGSYGKMAKMCEGLLGRTRDAKRLKEWANDRREKMQRDALERVDRQRNESALQEAGYLG